ncbi:MAG: TonB-dependent receptor [Bacteroidaceae bacterium]|nr:TonB-dependent receptor [Bacteroidaceae bacterium]
MKESKIRKSRKATFSHFSRKGYAVFASFHREVRIAVLSVSTLGSVCIQKVDAHSIPMHVGESDESVSEAVDEHTMNEVTVAGSMAPLTLLQSARMVSVITRSDIERAAAQSVNDLLKLATGVDVRQRGGFGIQTDISINGGTFDQITILLNGVNISNPHTGHLAADFPVSMADIERIEVLEGAASRVYGASAFGGAINIVTKKAAEDKFPTSGTEGSVETAADSMRTHSPFSLEAGMHGGSYGTAGADMRLALSSGRRQPSHLFSSLSGSYLRSDGANANSDFYRSNLFYYGGWESKAVDLHAQAGWSHKRYGANTFYSAAYPNQWEGNDRIIVSAGASTKGRVHFTPEVYWHRTYDHFQLIRNTATGENFHRTDVFGVRLGMDFQWVAGRTAFAAELRPENIYSTNLGQPIDSLSSHPKIPGQDGAVYTKNDSRTNVSVSVEHNVLLGAFTASVGLLANYNSYLGDGLHLYPGVDLSFRPARGWKLFASYNKGFRLPTFTDLYYKSPTIMGNRNLKAEESHSFQIGASSVFNFEPFVFRSSVKGFYNRGYRMIDWVMYDASDVYHSVNFDLDNMGISADVRLDMNEGIGLGKVLKTLSVGYAYMYQKRHDDVSVYKSNYAMEYLRHQLNASLEHHIWSRLSANWTLRWREREGSYLKYQDAVSTGELVAYSPYTTLDLKVQWVDARYQLWIEGTNLFNREYYDLGNIPQPGLMVLAGFRVKF